MSLATLFLYPPFGRPEGASPPLVVELAPSRPPKRYLLVYPPPSGRVGALWTTLSPKGKVAKHVTPTSLPPTLSPEGVLLRCPLHASLAEYLLVDA
jgi:hypothetical protein